MKNCSNASKKIYSLVIAAGISLAGVTGCMPNMLGLQSLPKVEMSAEAPYTKGTPLYEMDFHTNSMPGLMGGQFIQAETNLHAHPAPANGESAKAYHMIPAGMKLGEYLPLLPPVPVATNTTSNNTAEQGVQDFESFKIKIYWGCGSKIAKNQPKIIDFKQLTKGHEIQKLMSMANSQTANYSSCSLRQVKPGWALAEWPNNQYAPQIPQGASLVGQHTLHGNFIPHMQFNMTNAHDIMPALNVSSSSSDFNQAITLSWNKLPTALGYQACAIAFNQQKKEMIVWISGKDPNTHVSRQFLSPAEVTQHIKKKNIHDANTLQCIIPAGIFTGSDMVMATVTAWGSDYWASYPAKPKNAPKDWKPDWTVHGRFLSTGMTMLGFPAMQIAPQPTPNAPHNSGNVFTNLLDSFF